LNRICLGCRSRGFARGFHSKLLKGFSEERLRLSYNQRRTKNKEERPIVSDSSKKGSKELLSSLATHRRDGILQRLLNLPGNRSKYLI